MELISPRLVMDTAESTKEAANSGHHAVEDVVTFGWEVGFEVGRRRCEKPMSVNQSMCTAQRDVGKRSRSSGQPVGWQQVCYRVQDVAKCSWGLFLSLVGRDSERLSALDTLGVPCSHS